MYIYMYIAHLTPMCIHVCDGAFQFSTPSLPHPVFPVGTGNHPQMGRDSLDSVLSEGSTSDEEKRRSGSNDRVSPERHDLTVVRRLQLVPIGCSLLSTHDLELSSCQDHYNLHAYDPLATSVTRHPAHCMCLLLN